MGVRVRVDWKMVLEFLVRADGNEREREGDVKVYVDLYKGQNNMLH